MQLSDLPIDILANVIDKMDTKKVLYLASLAKYSVELQLILHRMGPRPIALKVITMPETCKITGEVEKFEETTLTHVSNSFDVLRCEDSSAIYFDTLFFNISIASKVIFQFILGTPDDIDCMIELLNKVYELKDYKFSFQLSIYKQVKVETRTYFTLPSHELSKFNWSKVSFCTTRFKNRRYFRETYYRRVPCIKLFWLKTSEKLEYLQIGERLSIYETLDDFYFSNLKTLIFDSCDFYTCLNREVLLNNHANILENLTMRHDYFLCKFDSFKNLKKLELSGFPHFNLNGLSVLLDKRVQLVIKGYGANAIHNCCKNHGLADYSNITIAECHKSQYNYKLPLLKQLKVKVIPAKSTDYTAD